MANNILLAPGFHHSDMIFIYITKWSHDKSGYHLAPHEVITVLLTIFSMLYITSPWHYFITGSFYLLILFTYFACSPTPTCSGNYQFASYIYESVSVLFCLGFLFCFVDSTCKWSHTVFVFLCLTYFTYIIPSRSIHVIANGKISFFLLPSNASLYLHTTSSSTHLSVGACTASRSRLL